MKPEGKKATALVLGIVFFAISSETTLLAIYHEWMHVIAYRMMDVDVRVDSWTSVWSERLHPFGLWGAYPLEVLSISALGWVVAGTKAWPWAGATIGFAIAKFFRAFPSQDFNGLAARMGPEVPGMFKSWMIVIVLPVLVFLTVFTIRRFSASYRWDKAMDAVAQDRAKSSLT